MSAATLATIELALYTALSGLLTNVTTGPTTSRPFACVGRYAGPVPPEGLVGAEDPHRHHGDLRLDCNEAHARLGRLQPSVRRAGAFREEDEPPFLA